jgi:hypothetical protein
MLDSCVTCANCHRDVAAAGAQLFVSSAAADAKAAKEGQAASTDLIESLVRWRLPMLHTAELHARWCWRHHMLQQ